MPEATRPDHEARKAAARAIGSKDLTVYDDLILQWQWKLFGSFKTALWSALVLADDDNLELLSKAFPHDVHALRLWRTMPWVKTRLEERGLL